MAQVLNIFVWHANALSGTRTPAPNPTYTPTYTLENPELKLCGLAGPQLQKSWHQINVGIIKYEPFHNHRLAISI